MVFGCDDWDDTPWPKQDLSTVGQSVTIPIEKLLERKVCNHILGMEEGVDEHWLVYKSRGWFWHKPKGDLGSIAFVYCPLCGEKL